MRKTSNILIQPIFNVVFIAVPSVSYLHFPVYVIDISYYMIWRFDYVYAILIGKKLLRGSVYLFESVLR